jgi:hypothetical protein
MIPFGNHTVTLLHKTAAGYTRYILNGCSWKSTNTRTLLDGATAITERTTCRIPPQYTKPAPGDLLILGDVRASVSGDIELVRLMDDMRSVGYRAFRVESCADNSTGVPLPHYAAIGE